MSDDILTDISDDNERSVASAGSVGVEQILTGLFLVVLVLAFCRVIGGFEQYRKACVDAPLRAAELELERCRALLERLI